MKEFGNVFKKCNLKVNATKSKVLVFKRNSNTECTIMLDGQDGECENIQVFVKHNEQGWWNRQ